ncbi:MAG: dihydropteroate synthase [Desulfurococcaceae archaeon]
MVVDLTNCRGFLGKLEVGDGLPVRVMGVINVSPESFFKGSIAFKAEELPKRVEALVDEGADLIDIGGMSTAPYLNTMITVEEELERVTRAVRIIKDITDIPISVDTFRSKVADAALKLGAEVINDVTGLRGDPKMVDVLLNYRPSLVVCPKINSVKLNSDPVNLVIETLRETLDIITSRGLNPSKVIVDPCIGFHRFKEIPWYIWDLTLISKLDRLKVLSRPILIGVSRKSFIGAVLGKERPEERLYSSLAYTAIAVLKGAHVIRTHDVAASKDVIKAVESFKHYNLTLVVDYPFVENNSNSRRDGPSKA